MKCYLYLILLLILSSSVYAQGAKRIAVAGGSITEIIYRLGEEQRIVGVDSTSQFPEAAKSQPLLGYVRNVSAEGVLSLSPDLLLGEADAGPPKILNQLQAAGVKTVILAQDNTLEALKQKITKVAELIDAPKKGEALLQDIQVDLDALSYAKKYIKTSPKVLFLLSISNGSPMAAGYDTSAHTAITEAGGMNVLGTSKGWTKLSPEGALGLNPEVIVVMNRNVDELDELKTLPHFKYSKAVKNNAVYTIDGSYLLGFGPRTPQAIVELGTMIHPAFPLPKGYTFRYENSVGANIAGH